jgi:hypothetical protein
MTFTIPDAYKGAANDFYYGAYASKIESDADRQALWDEYLALFRPDQGNGYTANQLELKEDVFIQALFGVILKEFFYEHAVKKNLNITSTTTPAELKAFFTAYLTSSDRASTTKSQSSVLLWVWEVVGEALVRMHDAAPTKASYALAMTNAELAAVNAMSNIKFETQSSAADYSTSSANMTKQKELEGLRAWRGLVGKKTQTSQSMMTSLRDNASQQSQLMSAVMQIMESMIQAVIKR